MMIRRFAPLSQRLARAVGLMLVLACVLFAVSACNLVSSDARVEALTQAATTTVTPGTATPPGTLAGTRTLPPLNVTTVIGVPTALPGVINNNFLRPTAVVILPPTIAGPSAPANTLPTGIFILAPANGNIVAGSVQIIGSASHPQFVQYVVEYGPEPNNANLWYQATSAIQTPVNNGLLGIWNTSVIPDGTYQLRLRVFLRDGTLLSSTVSGIRTQNRQATPVPTNTPSIPGPIAAFSQNTTIGTVPLAVQFTNQSSGSITSYLWNFGDGTTSTEINPAKTFTTPDLYTVSLTVTGPGGSANVSQQISARGLNAPVAAFEAAPTTGTAPLTVQFTNRSVGSISSYFWNFSDGTRSADANPSHTFTVPGRYNVFLTVTGPGGSTFVNREIIVNAPAATTAPTSTTLPAASATSPVVPTATADAGVPASATAVAVLASETPAAPPSATPIPASETPIPSATPAPPAAVFTASAVTGNAPLSVQFENTSTGEALTYAWDFDSDGQIDSSEQNPTFSFTAPGTYTVLLTVTNSGGSSTFPLQITVADPATATPTETPVPVQAPPLAASLPVQPNASDPALSGRAGEIAATGAAQGRSTARFAVAGAWATGSRLLQDFGPGASYNIEGNAALQSVIDRFNNGGDGTFTSFTPPPLPIIGEATAARLNDPAAADPATCTPGETPLACYLRVWSPGVVFIGVGASEAQAGLDAPTFTTQIAPLLQTAINSGVLPVVLTLPAISGVPAETINAYNDALIGAANAERVPVLNLWNALQPFGETSGTLTAAPGGAGDLTGGAVASYTANNANAALLELLRQFIESGLLR